MGSLAKTTHRYPAILAMELRVITEIYIWNIYIYMCKYIRTNVFT